MFICEYKKARCKCTLKKPVSVCSYLRKRFGFEEVVRSHCRKLGIHFSNAKVGIEQEKSSFAVPPLYLQCSSTRETLA